MPNNLGALVPQVISTFAMTLRKRNMLATKVAHRLDMEAMGTDTVDVPIPQPMTATDATAGVTRSGGTDLNIQSVKIPVKKHLDVSFAIRDSEAVEIVGGLVNAQMMEAAEALANGVDSEILNTFLDTYNYAGTAGTTPFSSFDEFLEARAEIRKVYAQGRLIQVFGPDAEVNLLKNEAIQRALNWGTAETATIRTGEVPMVYGTEWCMNQNVKRFDPEPGSAVIQTDEILNANAAKGATSISVAGLGTSNAILPKGAIITVGGDRYAIGEGQTITNSTSTIQLASPLRKAYGTNTPVRIPVTTAHVINPLFESRAVAFASKALPEGRPQDGIYSMGDPHTGLAYRVEVIREHNQYAYKIDCRIGAGMVYPQLTVRVMG